VGTVGVDGHALFRRALIHPVVAFDVNVRNCDDKTITFLGQSRTDYSHDPKFTEAVAKKFYIGPGRACLLPSLSKHSVDGGATDLQLG
jgi:hypothetical protein